MGTILATNSEYTTIQTPVKKELHPCQTQYNWKECNQGLVREREAHIQHLKRRLSGTRCGSSAQSTIPCPP